MRSQSAPLPQLSQEQRIALAELLSRDTGFNCFDDAVSLVDQLGMLIEIGIRSNDIVRWVALLPRVKDRAAALASTPPPTTLPIGTVDDLPLNMRNALRPATDGNPRKRSVRSLTDPSKAAKQVRSKELGVFRAATGVCSIDGCGVEFEMTPGSGRPATKCPEHRRGKKAS